MSSVRGCIIRNTMEVEKECKYSGMNGECSRRQNQWIRSEVTGINVRDLVLMNLHRQINFLSVKNLAY